MKLSKYLTLKEGIKSNTAIKNGIDNTPNNEQLENMKHIAQNIFDPVREFVGAPLGCNSFLRVSKLNKMVGGSPSSQHVKGQAIDIDCDVYGNGSNSDVFHFIKNNLEWDQLIWEYTQSDGEPAWVHVSLKKSGNRRQVLRKEKGKGYEIWDG